MICWIRVLRTIGLLLYLLGLNACYGTESPPENTTTSTPKTINSPSLQLLNCPLNFSAYTHENYSTNQIWLSFKLEPNNSFKRSLGDACKGDMKNLWQDMKRFESKIEKHYPNIDHITGLFTYNSDYFPTTKEQIKRFIADKADEVTLKAKLSLHDRSTLNGALEIKRLSTEFIIESVQEYLDQEHRPIIENTLAEKNIKMGSYSAEKLGYCYRFLRRCGDLPINKNTTENDEPDFMFIGVTFDWWKFEHGNHEKVD